MRPRLEEVRGAFAAVLSEEAAAAADAEFGRGLAEERQLSMAEGAAEIMRRVAADPSGELESNGVLAEFAGGTLTAGQAARFMHSLPQEIRPELREGPDWGVEDFARQQLELYMESVVARTKTLQTLSPFLAKAILEEVEWEIDLEGIQAAMDPAQNRLDLAGYEEVGG